MRRFQTLGELIGLYAQPNQGLVCALLLPVEREREPESPDDRDASGVPSMLRGHCAWPLPEASCFFPPTLLRSRQASAPKSEAQRTPFPVLRGRL